MANKEQPKRKSMSNKLRFDIFKRDQFKCKYCGRTPDDGIILHVDHILPVSKGGDNTPINLATACSDCNHGKFNHKLDEGHNPIVDTELTKQNEILERKNELKAQLKKYYKFLKDVDFDPVDDLINEVLEDELEYTLNKNGMRSFRRIYNKLTMNDFRDAVEVLSNSPKEFSDVGQKHKYLCGIMHNKYREQTDPAYHDEQEIRMYYLNHPHKKGTDYYIGWKINPYIHTLGVKIIKRAIDEVFIRGYRTRGYFSSVTDLLGYWEDED